MRLRRRSYSLVRRPMGVDRLKRSNAWNMVKMIILIASVSAGVLVMIFFGFPLIEDLVKGVDPMERYQPKVEKDFDLQPGRRVVGDYEVEEVYLPDYKLKNEPYIFGNEIIFTTHNESQDVYQLDAVAIYSTTTGEVRILQDVTMKYDNLISPKMSSDYAVWIDSMVDGGGRIVGYDFSRNKQFTIKEFGYAIPQLSMEGDLLVFMQWAGDKVQRLYTYNVRTQEAVTVKLYETEIGNSAADISANDIVWSEYNVDQSGKVTGSLKSIRFEGDTSSFQKYSFDMDVFEPKTNGRDIIFSTGRNVENSALMMSRSGGTPLKIADNVLNYDIGEDFIAYTQDEKVHICFTNQQETYTLSKDVSKDILMCANGTGVTFYDITDGVLPDEVVKYAFIE